MDTALRNLVGLGVPWREAVAAMTARPARLLGRSDIGHLTPGGRADVVVLAEDMSIERVLVAGKDL
jgi:N-acetylglucosamine-6-phosphate deacetylase